jgi:hypothetical protein
MYLRAWMVPLLSPCKGESGRVAAAAGNRRVYIPLARRGTVWMPKTYGARRKGLLLGMFCFGGILLCPVQ